MDDTPIGAFTLDSRGAGASGFGDFRHRWRVQVGDGFPLPRFDVTTTADFRVRLRVTRVRDIAITGVDGASGTRTADGPSDADDQVRLWIVHRGAWMLGGSRHNGEHTVSAGQFLFRRAGKLPHFATPPRTTARVIVLPAAPLAPLLGDRGRTGPAGAAEVRLLVAHANMIHRTLPDLGPAGIQAARDALLELAGAAARSGFDDRNARLAPTLAQAAKDLADRRLADRDLSPVVLARQLNVSVRTLHRAFAVGGESVTAYIRDRRLEAARTALTASRLSISEIAAYWQFADGSHFSRAFRKRYGLSPTAYARTSRSR